MSLDVKKKEQDTYLSLGLSLVFLVVSTAASGLEAEVEVDDSVSDSFSAAFISLLNRTFLGRDPEAVRG